VTSIVVLNAISKAIEGDVDRTSRGFERNPGIEDSVTESYKDKAYAKQQE